MTRVIEVIELERFGISVELLRTEAARPEAVFEAIADARSYPKWWRPVYLDVAADGPPRLGAGHGNT